MASPFPPLQGEARAPPLWHEAPPPAADGSGGDDAELLADVRAWGLARGVARELGGALPPRRRAEGGALAERWILARANEVVVGGGGGAAEGGAAAEGGPGPLGPLFPCRGGAFPPAPAADAQLLADLRRLGLPPAAAAAAGEAAWALCRRAAREGAAAAGAGRAPPVRVGAAAGYLVLHPPPAGGAPRFPLAGRLAELAAAGGARAAYRVALRYAGAAAGAGGQQWATPAPLADALWGAGVRLEAFASPLNSLAWGRGGAFFSAFPDVDAPFGSRGSFFAGVCSLCDAKDAKVRASSFPPGGWLVNPPFTEALLERAARCVEAALATPGPPFAVYFVAPAWRDSAAWRLLAASRFLVAAAELEGGRHCYDNAGTTVVTRAASTVFVLAAGGAPALAAERIRALAAPF